MATQTLTYKPVLAHGSSVKAFFVKYAGLLKRHAPPRNRILSLGLLLAGLGIPFLMALEIIPATLFLGFIGLAFIASGGILVLFYI